MRQLIFRFQVPIKTNYCVNRILIAKYLPRTLGPYLLGTHFIILALQVYDQKITAISLEVCPKNHLSVKIDTGEYG